MQQANESEKTIFCVSTNVEILHFVTNRIRNTFANITCGHFLVQRKAKPSQIVQSLQPRTWFTNKVKLSGGLAKIVEIETGQWSPQKSVAFGLQSSYQTKKPYELIHCRVNSLVYHNQILLVFLHPTILDFWSSCFLSSPCWSRNWDRRKFEITGEMCPRMAEQSSKLLRWKLKWKKNIEKKKETKN